MMLAASFSRVAVPRVAMPKTQRRTSIIAAAEGAINPDIKKDSPKVVDEVVASTMEKPMVAYCRCWRSKTFPLCNGEVDDLGTNFTSLCSVL